MKSHSWRKSEPFAKVFFGRVHEYVNFSCSICLCTIDVPKWYAIANLNIESDIMEQHGISEDCNRQAVQFVMGE